MIPAMQTPHFKISVRSLVDFALRSGDLSRAGPLGRDRAAEGIRAHQEVQRGRPPAYQTEVPVTYLIEEDVFSIEIGGRVDGLLVEEKMVLVEEIKTTHTPFDPHHPDNPLHWAQAQTYAYILAEQNDFREVQVQLTYVQLDEWKLHEDRRTFTFAELSEFFGNLIAVYLRWTQIHCRWREVRDQSIASLGFPFPSYRKGQRRFILAAYRSILGGGRLFAQAPAGIGKTISAVFPAVKAMGRGHLEKIFYLTAKTSGRMAVEKCLDDMRGHGMKLKSLTLTARDKICFNPSGLQSCDPDHCEYAIGYFDRINAAIEEIFRQDAFTRTAVEAVASKHKVCPFEFSLDLSLWADIIICDYNYVFDPRVFLKRFFLDRSGNYALLVDEAHNLVDRARAMFSADLCRQDVLDLERVVERDNPDLAHTLQAINASILEFRERCKSQGIVAGGECLDQFRDLTPLLQEFLDQAGEKNQGNVLAPHREEMADFYFKVMAFQRTVDLIDEHFTAYVENEGNDVRLRILCLDPSHEIRSALARGMTALFFSATLTPLPYFRDLLGGEEGDPLLSLESPFPHRKLHVLVADHIDTTYKRREFTYDDVSACIAATTDRRCGNYLAFFPSYRYMEAVAERFQMTQPGVETIVQRPGMSEHEREEFLQFFEPGNRKTMVGFAVLGGIFGEGVDLVGERLVGAVIVGVGLPQICLERNLIRSYYDQADLPGFEYAYTYPGMNRVLQAAGRVIRTANDRGVVLLIDSRFGQQRYRRMFPAWWYPCRIASPGDIQVETGEFWKEEG